MLTYVYFGTNDLARAISFYGPVLTPLGMQRCVTGDPAWDRTSAGWGTYEQDGLNELAFWIGLPFDQRPATVGNGSMVAFKARSWTAVDDFHAAALKHGGACDGPPGLRLHYSPDFYAAYVRDPDGNKIAAVCRGFTERPRHLDGMGDTRKAGTIDSISSERLADIEAAALKYETSNR